VPVVSEFPTGNAHRWVRSADVRSALLRTRTEDSTVLDDEQSLPDAKILQLPGMFR